MNLPSSSQYTNLMGRAGPVIDIAATDDDAGNGDDGDCEELVVSLLRNNFIFWNSGACNFWGF